MEHATQRTAPKQARAKATRRKLLDAAVQSLCELGCAGTTTTVVATRAGVSQGALYKHFGSKQQLLAATTEHLFKQLFKDFRKAFASGAGEKDHLVNALKELWTVFLTPQLYAVIELYLSARTDEPLRQALVPVLNRHRENLLAEARALFPEAAANNPRFNVAVESILATLQGAAITTAVLNELPDAVELGLFFESICRRELEPPYGVG